MHGLARYSRNDPQTHHSETLRSTLNRSGSSGGAIGLANCPTCGHSVATSATACANCGAKLKPTLDPAERKPQAGRRIPALDSSPVAHAACAVHCAHGEALELLVCCGGIRILSKNPAIKGF
ncbi:zinc ribbon domain-containing protein [Lysobacter arvi]|uniref:zinc ribbon domain-containing protein n=1 Tax=Lysobacter arvi TaxID=3038776 RepID=UPI003CCDF400